MAVGLLVAALFAPARSGRAEEALVAVASNFLPVAERLVERFEANSSHEIILVSGSMGKLYAQIVRGAPFDVFLAADAERPVRLVDAGHAVASSRRTYAIGRLALWRGGSGSDQRVGLQTLRAGTFRRLAIANPDLAPYGVAAREVLERSSLWTSLGPRLVFGENIGQTFGLVASGNAELGFVAASQLVGRAEPRWLVPSDWHAPIRQDLVLLERAASNGAARAFVAYLGSEPARLEIHTSGYEVE